MPGRPLYLQGHTARESGALATAQRELIREGVAPAAWSGLVVMGDGDQVALPGGRPRITGVQIAGLGVLGAAVIFVATALIRRRSG